MNPFLFITLFFLIIVYCIVMQTQDVLTHIIQNFSLFQVGQKGVGNIKYIPQYHENEIQKYIINLIPLL